MSSLSKSLSSSCSEDDSDLRRGPWTLDEDNLLIHYISLHGEGRWNLLAKRAGLRRTGKSCRLRWLNYLKPDVKRGNLTPQEQLVILDLHSKWGNRWSKIAQQLPGRTDNEIKNYWRTRVQKQARHLKVDANSTAFQDIIRSFWMPRLLQKIEGPTSSPPVSQNPTIISESSISYVPPQNSGCLQLPPPPSLPPAVTMQKFEHLNQEKNSDSENCTASSCISWTESMIISQISQLSENKASPFHAMNTTDCNNFVKDCYFVDINCYDMETINTATMQSVPGEFENQAGNPCQVAESNWVGCDFGDAPYWNIDELGQFRNLFEKNICS